MVTDLEIQALVDNELLPDEEESVLKRINLSFVARRRYEELKRQKQLLAHWFETTSLTH